MTPNIPEAEVLADMDIKNEEDIIKAARKIQKFRGKKCSYKKEGHRKDNCTDILLLENGETVNI